MYRVYILILLAIGFSAFAVDSSQSILQAKKITDTSFTVSWSPIADAVKYKIFYDESSLLDPVKPRLLLDTDFVTTSEFEVTKVAPSTKYTVIVHGYTMEGKDLGESIPLHVQTYSPVPPMNLARDPLVSQETILELAFSRPIDVTKTQITIQNPETKKNLPIKEITSSPLDLRIIIVTLVEKMELGVPYEMTLQKVVSLDGTELAAENRIPLKIVYGGVLPSFDTIAPEPTPSSDLINDEITPEEPAFTTPVAIDTLPQTGPGGFIVFVLLSVALFFAQKKLSERA